MMDELIFKNLIQAVTLIVMIPMAMDFPMPRKLALELILICSIRIWMAMKIQ